MKSPTTRRSPRRSTRREEHASTDSAPSGTDPAAQNRAPPKAAPAGKRNKEGGWTENLEYQRDLGSEQDA